MNFDVFDKDEIEKYKEEVIAKWGGTKAYQEYRQKDIVRNKVASGKIANELMTIFSEIGGLKHLTPDSDEVQKKISAIQKFITDNYYTCTNEILSGLGEMYVMSASRTTLTKRAGLELLILSNRLLSHIAVNGRVLKRKLGEIL